MFITQVLTMLDFQLVLKSPYKNKGLHQSWSQCRDSPLPNSTEPLPHDSRLCPLSLHQSFGFGDLQGDSAYTKTCVMSSETYEDLN